MKLTAYGRSKLAVCQECYSEALAEAYEKGPPAWLYKDHQGNNVVIQSPEYERWWRENMHEQNCFVVDCHCDYDSEEILVFCPDHLRALADFVESA